MKSVGKFLVKTYRVTALTLGTLGLLLIALAIAGAVLDKKQAAKVETGSFVIVNVGKEIVSSPHRNPLEQLLSGKPLLPVLDAAMRIRQAAGDERVSGLILLTYSAGDLSLADVRELREAVRDFKYSGKKTFSYADSFGLETEALKTYYLASATEEIWMSPAGDWAVSGLYLQAPFLQNLFAHLGIESTVIQREEYKSAAEIFYRREFSPPAKENLQTLAGGLFKQITDEISAERQLPPAELTARINQIPVMAVPATQARLVDHLGYPHEFLNRLTKDTGNKPPPFVALSQYTPPAPKAHDKATIAIIHTTGPVLRDQDLSSNVDIIDGLQLSEQLYQLADTPGIRAVVLTIDSPGGSFIASDMVYGAVQYLKSKKIPLIAYMRGTAASGGYYIAMGADEIIAQPVSITGSIGVVLTKPNARAFLNSLGITFDGVQVGDHANLLSLISSLTPQQKQSLESSLDEVYRTFVSNAAASRGMSFDDMRQRAKGYVWLGSSAQTQGLVDQTGTYALALSRAKKLADVPEDREPRFVIYPEPQDPWKQILNLLSLQQGFWTQIASLTLQVRGATEISGWQAQSPVSGF